MSNEEVLGNAIGSAVGSASVVFLAVVNALRKQPNFDDDKFQADIRDLLEKDSLDEMQRGMLLALIDSEES